ncbi:MAG: glycosyltransferase, partial [Desulfohalobiaceae bacterium]
PLFAAQQLNVPTACHVREIITQDPQLCKRLELPAHQIVTNIIENVDYIIANSRATQQAFPKPGAEFLVYNAVDLEHFDLANTNYGSKLYAGMISSNTEKKGVFDVLQLARQAEAEIPNLVFRLIGPENEHTQQIKEAIQRDGGPNNLEITGYIQDSAQAVSMLNIGLNFTQVPESFGRSVVECMSGRRPVIVYNRGALPELVKHPESGFIISDRCPEQALQPLKRLVEDPELMARMGENARMRVGRHFSFERMQEQLDQALDTIFRSKANSPGSKHQRQEPPQSTTKHQAIYASQDLVSVIIPNFNYQHFLQQRIASITQQTHQNMELIFLDDASEDNSVQLASKLLHSSGLPYRIIQNQNNQGTYKQWVKGITEAQGEYLWIAEADDTCDPEMLEKLLQPMLQDPAVVLAYCQSRRIDQHGNLISADNLKHTHDLDPERWKRDYHELGLREVVDYLVYRNTLPNSSACLLRKSAVLGIEKELSRSRFCGDRLLYAHMLRSGKIAYIAQPMNAFRRHLDSVTQKRHQSQELLEEVTASRKFICAHFPVHPSQFPRIKYFLDRDYKAAGVKKNSQHPKVNQILNSINELISGNRRFAFITTNDNSYDGGSELWWRETAMRLRRQGHDVVVLLKKWDPPPPFLRDFAQLGIKYYFKEDQGLQKIISFCPDLVALSLGDQDHGVQYYSKLQASNIPYVIVNRLTKEPRFSPVSPDLNHKVRTGYLGAQKIFFASANNHKVMQERLQCRLSHWGRIFSPCHADPNTELPFPPISKGINIAVPAKILFLHKGQDLIVEVMRQQKWKARNITVNFYGQGPDQDRLQDMLHQAGLEKILVLHGRLVHIGREKEISRIWLKNQAVLMPSRMEGFPNMVINAMLSGRLPIVTDIGGHREAIQDGITGFIARNPDPAAVDDALERAYQRRNEWQNIGQQAREAASRYLPQDPIQDAADKILALTKATARQQDSESKPAAISNTLTT